MRWTPRFKITRWLSYLKYQISNIVSWLRYLVHYQISNIMRWLRYLAQVQLLHPDEVGEDTGSKFLYEVLSQ